MNCGVHIASNFPPSARRQTVYQRFPCSGASLRVASATGRLTSGLGQAFYTLSVSSPIRPPSDRTDRLSPLGANEFALSGTGQYAAVQVVRRVSQKIFQPRVILASSVFSSSVCPTRYPTSKNTPLLDRTPNPAEYPSVVSELLFIS